MPKIKCPKCSAMNQDVSADDPCWQCGSPLSAPAAATVTATAEPAQSAGPADADAAPAGPIQKQIEHPRPPDKIPIEERYAPSGPNYAAIGIIVAVLALIILAVLFGLKVIHF